jgi:transposase
MIDLNTEIEARRVRGALLAKTKRVSSIGGNFLVPSQTHGGRYLVSRDEKGAWTCTCPDFAERGVVMPCKHIVAVEIVRAQITPDGTPMADRLRVTYTQDWTSYNAAQVNEKEKVVALLRELVSTVPELPRKPGPGRKPLPIADVLMSAMAKVYIGWSGRRSMSEMRDLGSKGLLDKVPSYNSVFRYMENPALTPILVSLVQRAAMPLVGLGGQTDFAVDSTGISLRTYAPGYRNEKYGVPVPKQHGWVKLHAIVDTTSHVITSVVVKHGSSGDAPEFKPLVEQTVKNGFKPARISADAAYASHENIQCVVDLGAEPLVPFPIGRGYGADAPESYRQAYHYFQFNRPAFLSKYGKRQNVEATFSSFKRVVTDTLRSRSADAQVNEALAAAVVHNVIQLVHAMYKMNFEPHFPMASNGGLS